MSERIVKFSPAWNKVDPDPAKNYGIRAMGIEFYLKGELAVVQFTLSTNWYLPGDRQVLVNPPYEMQETRPEVIKRRKEIGWFLGGVPNTRKVALCDYYAIENYGAPTGYDVGYHSPVALYTEQHERDDCSLLPGGKCFYDGSSLRAQSWAKQFLAEGEDWLWKEMSEYLESIESQVKAHKQDEQRFS